MQNPLNKYQEWTFEKWQEEIAKAKADLEAANDGYLSHQEEIERTAQQEYAAWRYSELIQSLRYMLGEREQPPRQRNPMDYLKQYYRHIN